MSTASGKRSPFQGRLRAHVYERKDDGTKEGYADLAVVTIAGWNGAMLQSWRRPPEIHTFVALEEDTCSVTVVGGHYAETRHYFKPDEKT